MNVKRTLLAAAVVAGALGATAVKADVVKVDGSSTVYPISAAAAEEFQKFKKGAVKVTVGVSGTGGGFKKFCRGDIDISDASRPIKSSEMEDCAKAGIKYVELPVAFDALTVVINPKNDWAKNITVAELKKIWEPEAQGKITKWNQINPKWPNAPIKLYGPGADSGTFEYFTEAVNGKAKASRGDFTASEDDNVLVTGVARDKNALGYFGYAYYAENKDKLVAASVDGGKGPVAPSAESVENGKYQPLSRPIFIYVSQKANARPEVKKFVDFYLKNADKLVREVGYVGLGGEIYALVGDRYAKQTLGSAFAGKNTVGVTLDQLLAAEK